MIGDVSLQPEYKHSMTRYVSPVHQSKTRAYSLMSRRPLEMKRLQFVEHSIVRNQRM